MISDRPAACFEEDEAMSDAIPVEKGPAEMFSLLDRETVRLRLPLLSTAGMAKPLRIHLDFDAESVDEMIECLTVPQALAPKIEGAA
jgi:hypothetical protein